MKLFKVGEEVTWEDGPDKSIFKGLVEYADTRKVIVNTGVTLLTFTVRSDRTFRIRYKNHGILMSNERYT